MSIWGSSTSTRARANAAAKKRERDRKLPRMHLKKVRAEIKAVGGFSSGVKEVQVVLSDISPKGVGFFSSGKLEIGETIALTLDEPKRFYVKGRVAWCQEYDATSHVLSTSPQSYRIGLEFFFDSEEEEAEVRSYCDLIASNHIFTKGAA